METSSLCCNYSGMKVHLKKISRTFFTVSQILNAHIESRERSPQAFVPYKWGSSKMDAFEHPKLLVTMNVAPVDLPEDFCLFLSSSTGVCEMGQVEAQSTV